MHRKRKVFGIGLPRTGTCSLTVAMVRLGCRSVHCCFDDSLYEKADFLCDTPIFCDFISLHRRYPDALFIHTIRDAGPWLASFRRSLRGFFEMDLFRENPINRRVYAAVFDTDRFDEEKMLAGYHAHRERVAAFSRKAPVLTMRIEEGWDALCPFLGAEKPAAPFPHCTPDLNTFNNRLLYRSGPDAHR